MKGKNEDEEKEPPDLTDVKEAQPRSTCWSARVRAPAIPAENSSTSSRRPQLAINKIVSDVGERSGIRGSTRTQVNEILRKDIRQARARGAKHYSQFIEMAPVLAAFIHCRDGRVSRSPARSGEPGIDCPRRPRREQDANIKVCFRNALRAESEAREPIAAISSPSAGAIQRTAATAEGAHSGSRSPRAAERVTASGGSPLPARERAYFEPRFGRDFSGVRISPWRRGQRRRPRNQCPRLHAGPPYRIRGWAVPFPNTARPSSHCA